MRLDLLYAHCADLGIEVRWTSRLPELHRGCYVETERAIYLAEGLTRVQTTATLAHELGHALYRDLVSTPANERRAWEIGAALIISVAEYADAERMVGHHTGALAQELDVTPILIEGWRRWYARTSSTARADRLRLEVLEPEV